MSRLNFPFDALFLMVCYVLGFALYGWLSGEGIAISGKDAAIIGAATLVTLGIVRLRRRDKS